MTVSTDFQKNLSAVKLLALDCDGVLTDGGVYVSDQGGEFRRFNIKDGYGLKAVIKSGIHVAIISASPNVAVQHRAQQLGIHHVHIGVQDKHATLVALCDTLHISLHQVCYVGDDLADLKVMSLVGAPSAPSDAVPAIQAVARYVTRAAGGQGAVREICDLLAQALKNPVADV